MSKHWMELRDESFKEYVTSQKRQKLSGRTPNQIIYLKRMETSTVTICAGPAGTGKTYMACGVAAEMLREGKVDKIIITRPIVGCDEQMGDLPGDLLEKVSEDMQPMLDALCEFFSRGEVERFIREERLLIVPFSKMRGRSFKRAFVVLDEAQNTTYRQLKMFLTRLGEHSRMVICGDHTQSDLSSRGRNSLLEVIDRFQPDCHNSISIVRLGREDIVRHELIQWMDERLSDDLPVTGCETYHPLEPAPSYPPRDSGWSSVCCPVCTSVLYYEDWVEEQDVLIGCHHCDASIELLDGQGILDPIAVDEKPGYQSYKEKP